MPAKVLMLSSSRKGDDTYLTHATDMIKTHLGTIKNVIFIPFAGVSISFDDYTQKVSQALPWLSITGLHQAENKRVALEHADAVLVGGGNTFQLLHLLYQYGLINTIKTRIKQGIPYIGWSAGSNICGMSIRTTNDMPIVEPQSFTALNVLPCQLNPHYTDYQPPGHNGETRDERLAEFSVLYPDTPILAIREGSALLLEDDSLTLLGDLDAYCFTATQKRPLKPGQDLSEYCRQF